MRRSRISLGKWSDISGRFVNDRKKFILRNQPSTFYGRFVAQQGESVHGNGYLGLSWGAATLRGWCSRNDDTFIVGQPAGLRNHAVFGVFDGHGRQGGDRASRLAASRLHRLIYSAHTGSYEVSDTKLKQSFTVLDRYLRLCRRTRKVNFLYSGTCAAVVVVGETDVVVANLGDSEVVAKNGRLTKLHTCENPIEAHRIESCGGFISEDQRVNGRLIPTRALGDFCLKIGPVPSRPVLSCVPEISRFSRSELGEFLVIGSDGIFDALSAAAVIQYCEMHKDLTSKQLAENLVDRAIGSGSQDNVTCVVVRLSDPLRRAASVTIPLHDTKTKLTQHHH